MDEIAGSLDAALESLKKAESDARRKESWFEQVFQSSYDAILIVAPDEDRIIDANPRAEELLEYTREELLGTPLSAIHPDELPRLKEFTSLVFEEGSGWTDALSCLTRGGRSIGAEVSPEAMATDGGRQMIAIVRDIRERK